MLLAQIGVLLLRGSSALVPGLGSDFLEQTPIQVVYLTAYPICTLMITVGYVLLATDRLRGELEYLSSHDSLTQILNRRAFVEVCEWEMARARRHGRALCLLMLDLDFFKKINDTYGHQAGDLVLQLASSSGLAPCCAGVSISAATAARNLWCCCPMRTWNRHARWPSASV